MAILGSEQIFDLTNFETSWDYLLSKSLDSNPFLTYEWLTAWSKHFGQGKELKLFTAGTNGRVSLAIPVSYSTRRNVFGSNFCEVNFIGAPHSDYQTFLVTDLQEANKSLNHLFESIIEDSGTNNIEFNDVPEDSATARLLQNIKADGFKVASSVFDSCPFVPLPANFEIFQQNLGSNMRRNLKVWEKQAKKEYQIKFVRYDEIGDLKEAMNIFFDLHQKRQIAKGEPGVFAHNVTRDFHMDIAKEFAKKGWLALFFLTFNDKPVATVYCFEYGLKLYAYLCGFDPDYSMFRPGHLAFSKALQYGIAKKLSQFDFLRGNEDYKTRWKPIIRNNLKFNIAKNGIKSKFYCLNKETVSLSHLSRAVRF